MSYPRRAFVREDLASGSFGVLKGRWTLAEFCVDVAFVAIFGIVLAACFALFPAEAAGAEWQCTVALLIWAALNAFFVVVYPRLWRRIAYGLVIATIGALIWLPHPRKVFVNELDSIKPGMTVARAVAIMNEHRFRELSWSPSPSIPSNATGCWAVRWNDSDGAFDADIGEITFENGRVIKVEFLPD